MSNEPLPNERQRPMKNPGLTQARRAGVLLHPTSLPSGKLDEDAFRWLDVMAEAGLSVWQMLPLGVPQEHNSPYQCLSSFAINPLLLADHFLDEVDALDQHFNDWNQLQSHWLDDYSLFVLLKKKHNQAAWFDWPEEYRFRDKDSLDRIKEEHKKDILAIQWQQYQLSQFWQEIRHYAHVRGITLFGDLPIFVAIDSADVWSNRECFLLDSNGKPQFVTGVPPDYFSATGQRWGNPHYNWDYLKEHDFDWWIKRIEYQFEWFDFLRIDHFRGLEAVWMISANSDTAVDGHWEKVPGDAFLARLLHNKENQGLIAEDLGIITDEVRSLRKKYNLPGMSVLQFGFDQMPDNPHKPENITSDHVAYTGTHDNDTTQGWFDSLQAEEQQNVMQVLGIDQPSEVVDRMIQNAINSPACMAIIPLQDFLKLGSEARMNTPGIAENNWHWQFSWNDIDTKLLHSIREAVINGKRHLPVS